MGFLRYCVTSPLFCHCQCGLVTLQQYKAYGIALTEYFRGLVLLVVFLNASRGVPDASFRSYIVQLLYEFSFLLDPCSPDLFRLAALGLLSSKLPDSLYCSLSIILHW